MKEKRTVAELILQTAIPVLSLLTAMLHRPLTAALGLPEYLVLCFSGLLTVAACLLWSCSLCARPVLRGVRDGMMMTALLLLVWNVLFYLSGFTTRLPAISRVFHQLSLAAPMLLPAALYRMCRAARRASDEQHADRVFFVLVAVGVVLGLSVLSWLVVENPVVLAVSLYAWKGWLVLGILIPQLLLLLSRRSLRVLPCAAVLLAEAVLLVCAVLTLGFVDDGVLLAAAPLLLFAFCELAFLARLLPDGHGWVEALSGATFPLQLIDYDGKVVYGSAQAMPLSANHKAAILNNRYPLSKITDRNVQLSAEAVRGGYALQQRDLRDLRSLQTSLDTVTAELEETMKILSQASELEAELQRVMKKNNFLAQQAAKIQEKTDRASLLLRCAAAPSPEPGFRRAVVTRANLLVTYIQQLGLLLQAARETDALPVFHLRNALEASARAATDAGARCRVYHVAQGFFPAEMLLGLYDLYEQLLEEVLSGAEPMLEIRLRNEQKGLRLILTVRDTTVDALSNRMPHITAQTEAMGGEARFAAEGHDVSVFIEFPEGGIRND